MTYLMQDRHGTFYLRLILSKEQRKKFNRNEYRRSLGTKSRREACRLLPVAYMQAMQELAFDVGVGDSASLDTNEINNNSHNVSKPNIPTLKEVFDAYQEYQRLQGYEGRVIDGKQPVMDLLFSVVDGGGDRPVDDYSKADARKIKEVLLQLPSRFQRELNKGVSLKELIKRHEGTEDRLSIITVNNYLGIYAAVFNHAIREDYIENNPFRGSKITPKAQLASSYREAFNKDDLSKIFSVISIQDREDRFFIPYLLYYTGARLSEICQLHRNDVQLIDGQWCIFIRAGNNRQRIKNLHSERMVPLHKDIIALGFIDYVGKYGETEHLFPMLTYTERNGYYINISAWFNSKLLKKLGLREGGRKVSMHSMRHTTINILKNMGIESYLISGLVGHSNQGSMTLDRYGKRLSPESLSPVVNRIPSVI